MKHPRIAARAALAVAAVLAFSNAGAASVGPPRPNVDDVFPILAAQGGNAEIDGARLALRRSETLEVRGFAQKMLAEHGALAERLASIAPAAKHVDPRENVADALAFERLERLAPADFDREYLTLQIGAHLATISLFETEEREGRNPIFKAFATRELPDIRAHLALAVGDIRHVGGSSPFYVH